MERLKAAFKGAGGISIGGRKLGGGGASGAGIADSVGCGTRSSSHCGGGGGGGGGGALNTGGDVKRIISDLQFSDIPAGEYEYTTQSLLSMLIKQDARIKVLERTVELLLAEREA